MKSLKTWAFCLTNLGALLTSASLTTATFAQDTLPRHWSREDTKEIYWIPDHSVEITLTEVEVDADNWAMLGISIGSDADLYSRQYQALADKFSTYQIKRSFAEVGGVWSLQIPSLNVAMELDPRQTADHIPYANTSMMVKKADYARLRTALKNDPASVVTIQGLIRANVPKVKTVVDWTSTRDVCTNLLRRGDGFYSVMQGYEDVSLSLQRTNLSPSVRAKAMHTIFLNCLEISEPGYVESFSDLALLRFAPSQETADLKVERKVTGMESENVSLRYQFKFVDQGGR
jgi:hypothetical protein